MSRRDEHSAQQEAFGWKIAATVFLGLPALCCGLLALVGLCMGCVNAGTIWLFVVFGVNAAGLVSVWRN